MRGDIESQGIYHKEIILLMKCLSLKRAFRGSFFVCAPCTVAVLLAMYVVTVYLPGLDKIMRTIWRILWTTRCMSCGPREEVWCPKKSGQNTWRKLCADRIAPRNTILKIFLRSCKIIMKAFSNCTAAVQIITQEDKT